MESEGQPRYLLGTLLHFDPAELIAARLFTECLGDHEALIMVGGQRYSHYEGMATDVPGL